MGRKSRRNPQNIEILQEKISKAAIYARLSVEDDEEEATSISNQLLIMKQYLQGRKDIVIVDEYVDNGCTGSNFDRPAFKKMMEDIRRGRINCIVVKDLSRFSRDYIGSGNYIEKIFPYIGVRFISVGDNYDSAAAKDSAAFLIAIKSLLHNAYLKDISKKICTSLDNKKKSGKFLGKVPYGYNRAEDDRYKLVVCEECADTVRKIFKWYLEGTGAVAIARRLNDAGVLSKERREYEKDNTRGSKTAMWQGSSVSGILTNPIYTGCIVECKSQNRMYNNHRETIPKEEWKLIENCHEAIVSKETFLQVKQKLEESGKQQREKMIKIRAERQAKGSIRENILTGLLVCGYCGSTLQRSSGYYDQNGNLKTYYYLCHRKYIKDGVCKYKPVKDSELIEAILKVCKVQLQVLANMNKIRQGQKNLTEKKNELQDKLKAAEVEKKKINALKNTMYENYKENKITKEMYLYRREQNRLNEEKNNKQIEKLMEEWNFVNQSPAVEKWNNECMRFFDTEELTKEMCQTMIEKVEVYEKHIVVHFKFEDEYKCNENSDGGVRWAM